MPPTIRILHGRDGAADARGIAVVIDVFRAFSTACYLVDGGVRRIVCVVDAGRATRLKRLDPGAVLIGERDGYRIPGFELGNSPSQVAGMELNGRTAVLTTSNGTMGLAAVKHAKEVITGSFVNAAAIGTYVRRRAPSRVSLVCMGIHAEPALEDTLCAIYLAGLIKGRCLDFKRLKRVILSSGTRVRFLSLQSPDMPPEDLDRCLMLSRFAFVLRLKTDPIWGAVLKRVDMDQLAANLPSQQG